MNHRRIVFTASLLLSGLLMASSLVAKDHKAQIVTQNSRASECISSVWIRRVNGKNKILSAQGFELEPGEYELSGTINFDAGNCPSGARSPKFRQDAIPPLKATFEGGKRYYVGFNHASSNQEEWAYVIWKEE